MKRVIISVIFFLSFLAKAEASTCGSLPFNFVNGTLADATQVMANFNALLSCANVLLAPLASPAFTGTPTAPTASTSTSNTQIATTAFVHNALNISPSTITTGRSVVTADCGNPIYAQGNAFYTITLPAVAGFSPGCGIKIVDNDPRGKTISVAGLSNGGFGYTGCGLSNICTGQSVTYRATASAWVLEENPGTWRPTVGVTYYVSTTGANTNDGLDASSPLTLAFACVARGFVDLGATGSGNNVTIQLADGTYTGAPGASLCSMTGNIGASSSAISTLNGNNSTPGNVIVEAGVGGTSIFTKDGAEVTLQNFAIFGDGSAIGIFGDQYSIVDVNTGMIFGCMGASGNGFQFGNASININTTVHMKGSPTDCTQGILGYVYDGGRLAGAGIFQWPAGVYNYTTAVFFNQGAIFDMRQIGFTIGATVTGKRFDNYVTTAGTGAAGALYTNGQPPSTLPFPGNIDVAFPLTFATDFAKRTTLSTVPACNTATVGQMYAITDSTTVTWGAHVSGGGGSGAIIVCSPDGSNLYTVMGI